MKKDYKRMEAYKVEFNANEQVAAAGCDYYTGNGKYSSNPGLSSCNIDESKTGNKFAAIGTTDPCAGVMQYA